MYLGTWSFRRDPFRRPTHSPSSVLLVRSGVTRGHATAGSRTSFSESRGRRRVSRVRVCCPTPRNLPVPPHRGLRGGVGRRSAQDSPRQLERENGRPRFGTTWSLSTSRPGPGDSGSSGVRTARDCGRIHFQVSVRQSGSFSKIRFTHQSRPGGPESPGVVLVWIPSLVCRRGLWRRDYPRRNVLRNVY